jgi:hypothetical protein
MEVGGGAARRQELDIYKHRQITLLYYIIYIFYETAHPAVTTTYWTTNFH